MASNRKPVDPHETQRRSALKIIRALSTAGGNLKVDEVREAVLYYSSMGDSVLEEDWSRMFKPAPKPATATLKPPAGLSAKDAIGVVIAYVQEDLGKPFQPKKADKSSFSALCGSLDAQFGPGFAEQVIQQINGLPGAGFSLHYKR